MSRLHDALQRADASQSDATGVTPDTRGLQAEQTLADFTLEPRLTVNRLEHLSEGAMRPSDVERASDGHDEQTTAGMDAHVSLCPHCAAPCEARASLWMRAWSHVRRNGAHRCRACRRTFHTPRQRFVSAQPHEPPVVPGFLQAGDRRSFQELIRDLAQDEAQRALDPGPPHGHRPGRVNPLPADARRSRASARRHHR